MISSLSQQVIAGFCCLVHQQLIEKSRGVFEPKFDAGLKIGVKSSQVKSSLMSTWPLKKTTPTVENQGNSKAPSSQDKSRQDKTRQDKTSQVKSSQVKSTLLSTVSSLAVRITV